MKVQILSPTQGGPFFWAKNLAKILQSSTIDARHIFSVKDLLLSPGIRDADIIHAAIPLFYSLFKKPIVLTVKGDIFLERAIWKLPYLLAIKNADVITTPSHFLKERLDLKDAFVIPNAVFSQDYRMAVHGNRSAINLITVTNFAFRDKSEGILDIIRILERVQKSTDKKIAFTVVGGGPHLANVMKSARESSIPLRFTGFLPHPQEELEKSDIFLYHSPHDNFPHVFLEAMASGLPVVTNAVGAADEIIDSGNTGFITKCDDDYEEIVTKLTSDPSLRAKQGKNARTRVETCFDWHCVVPEYISIYTNLLSSS